MFRAPRRSFFVPQTDGGRRFLASLGEEKPLIFLATVGMSTDGIAYNHYGIKYVLKRLGDQRRSIDSSHMEGERTGRWRERREKEKRENVPTGSAHINGKRNNGG